jgi:hypothetical protein
MFDEVLSINDLFNSYNALLVPVIVAQLLFLISYLIKKVKRG